VGDVAGGLVDSIENDEDNDSDVEREVVQHDGWYSLTWSFAISSLLTVSLALRLPRANV